MRVPCLVNWILKAILIKSPYTKKIKTLKHLLHLVVCRYKRLVCGLIRLKKLGKVVSDVLKSCGGVSNIADNFIVFGVNELERKTG